MVWQQYVLGAWVILGSLLTIAFIGKPRGPITNSTAVLSVVFTGIFVWILSTIPTE